MMKSERKTSNSFEHNNNFNSFDFKTKDRENKKKIESFKLVIYIVMIAMSLFDASNRASIFFFSKNLVICNINKLDRIDFYTRRIIERKSKCNIIKTNTFACSLRINYKFLT